MDFEKRLTAVEILLYLGVPVNPKSETLGTPLHLAVRNNCLEVAQLLLEYNADVNEVDKDRRTPLHLCAAFGCLKMAELLLKYCEIRPKAHGKKYKIPKDVNFLDIQLMKLLLKCYRNQGDKMRAELIYILKTHMEYLGLVDDKSQREYKEYKRTHEADDSYSCISFLESAYDALTTNTRFIDWEQFWTSYQKVQCKCHSEHDAFMLNGLRDTIDRYIGIWMQQTLREVSDMKMLGSNSTPLHLVVGSCYHSAISNFKDKAVQRSAKENMAIDFCALLLDHADEYKINSWRPRNHNSYNVSRPNHSKPIQITESVISYVNRKDSKGDDALIKAVDFNQLDIVQLLLRSGADTCSVTSHGYAALHVAVNSIHSVLKSSNPVEMIKVLLTSGEFSVNALTFKAETPLHLAISTGNCGCGRSEKASQECQGQRKITDSVISLLLENKANVNQKDCEGTTPLMKASDCGCYHIVKILLNSKFVKVDLDARDNYGETALIKASRMHHAEIVELLAKYGSRADLQDYRGFTALHATLYDPDKFTIVLELLENESNDIGLSSNEANKTVSIRVKDDTMMNFKNPLKGEPDGRKAILNATIKILLRNGLQFETLDFANNTPFDFLVESEIRPCRNRNEAQQRLDKMRNENDVYRETPCHVDSRWLHIMRRRETSMYCFFAIWMRCEQHHSIQPAEVVSIANFKDNNGRTALHYAAILSRDYNFSERSSVFKALLNIGCEIDAQDIYQRTPLHYMDVSKSNLLLGPFEQIGMESSEEQQLIVREILKIKDVDDKTVEQLWTLRKENAERERIRTSDYHKAVTAIDLNSILPVYDNGTMRIYPRAPYNFEMGVTWSIWMKGIADYAHHNTVTFCLTKEIHNFIDRLVNAIERIESCFKCHPMLVGSAFEGTKINSPDEFDFDLILTKFSNLVEVIPSPVAPEGFVHLRRKSNVSLKENDERFFDKEGILKTNEINCRFQIILGKVLQDPSFWKNECLFELTDAENTFKRFFLWYFKHCDGRDLNDFTDQRIKPSICTTIRLKQTRALEGQYLPNKISLDLVPCIHVDGWWPDKAKSDISGTLKANGCKLVFDQPQRKYPWVPFGENYARISFAPAESRIIRDSSPTAKAAYMVCKHLIQPSWRNIYVLKTCLLYCIEAIERENKTSIDDESSYSSVTAEKLSLWVEKLMRCLLMFFLQDFCPCYLMPSFCLPIGDFLKSNHMLLHVTGENDYEFLKEVNENDYKVLEEENQSFRCLVRELREVYIANFDLFRRVCTSDTDIPLPKPQPLWEGFNHIEFISALRGRKCRIIEREQSRKRQYNEEARVVEEKKE